MRVCTTIGCGRLEVDGRCFPDNDLCPGEDPACSGFLPEIRSRYRAEALAARASVEATIGPASPKPSTPPPPDSSSALRDPSPAHPVGIAADATGTPGTEALRETSLSGDPTTETIR